MVCAISQEKKLYFFQKDKMKLTFRNTWKEHEGKLIFRLYKITRFFTIRFSKFEQFLIRKYFYGSYDNK